MIDWVSFTAPCELHEPIHAGRVARFDENGELTWSLNERLSVEGSGSSAIQIRSVTAESYEFSGNLTKFFQGHNVFGTDDLQGLVQAWDNFAVSRGFPMIMGDPRLSRVDVNQSFKLPSQAEVLEWLRWVAQSAYLANRGRGSMEKEGTVYWGKHSRRSSLKAYAKQLELVATKKAKEGDALYRVSDGLLRVEGTYRGMELERYNVRYLSQWRPPFSTLISMSLLERLNIPENAPGESLLDVLPRHLQAPYAQWLHGRDPRKVYPRPTAYRHRKALLEHGIDIFIPPVEITKVGSHMPVEHKGWDVRKLIPWHPSSEEIATLGWFDPTAYTPSVHKG